MTEHIFKDHSKDYIKAGWKPIPVHGKFPPVVGATGHDGVVDDEKVKTWRRTHPDENIALRMETVVGIDVDAYEKAGQIKRGDKTLANYEERLGPLPKTYTSTARGKKTPSRQHFFRVPEGVKLATKIGNDIEVIQYHHRYAMVWPSIHPDLGTEYAWYAPDGSKAEHIPHVDELPDLPDAWLADLAAAPDSVLLDVETIEWSELVKTFPPGPMCHVAETFHDKVEHTAKTAHIGHDEALRLALEGFMLGREGHAGIGDVITSLASHFKAYLDQARPREAKAELKSVMASQASIAQRKPVEDTCACFTTTALTTIDKGLRKREKAKDRELPLLKNPTTLYIENARKRFMAEHPVKRYRGSTGMTYIWLGDRWQEDDIRIICYRWLSARLGNDMSKRKGDELANAVMAYADEIDEDAIDRRYISVANGLLDWASGELVERTPEIFAVNHLPVAWRPSASIGRFAEWMETAVEPEMADHVWEVIGYAISPVHDQKVALAFSGMGGGGKSTLINLLQNLVGTENTSHIAPQSLGDRFNRAQLHGKLLNAVGDVGAETIRNIGPLKSIIAGDSLSAEYKGRDGFSFRPNAFVVASFNTLPATESNDSGFWDRWIVLSFKQRFNAPGKVEDTSWRDEMPRDEAILQGVLVEAVSALRRLRARGSFDKAAFAGAKNEWRQEVDPIAAFVEERLVLDPSGAIKAKVLHEFYSRVELSGGGKPRKNQTFYRELLAYLSEKAPGQVQRTTQGANVLTFTGIKVLHNPDDAGLTLLDPNVTYGKDGWTSHPHIRLVSA